MVARPLRFIAIPTTAELVSRAVHAHGVPATELRVVERAVGRARHLGEMLAVGRIGGHAGRERHPTDIVRTLGAPCVAQFFQSRVQFTL